MLAAFGQLFHPPATPPKDSLRAELAELLAYRAKLLEEIAQRRQHLQDMRSAWVRRKAETHLALLVEERSAVTARIAETIDEDATCKRHGPR